MIITPKKAKKAGDDQMMIHCSKGKLLRAALALTAAAVFAAAIFAAAIFAASFRVSALAGGTAAPLRGDFDGNGEISSADAVRLLRSVLLPDQYEITQDGDVNGDGEFNTADAVYLLRHVLLPERYPLSGAEEGDSAAIRAIVEKRLEDDDFIEGIQLPVTFFQTLTYETIDEALTGALALGEDYTVRFDREQFDDIFNRYRDGGGNGVSADLSFTVSDGSGASADFTEYTVFRNNTSRYISSCLQTALKGNPIWNGKMTADAEIALEISGEFPSAAGLTDYFNDALDIPEMPDGITAKMTIDDNEYYDSLKEMYDEAEIGEEIEETLDLTVGASSYFDPYSHTWNCAVGCTFIVTKNEPAPEWDAFTDDGFYLTKDGKTAALVVSAAAPDKLLEAVRAFRDRLAEESGIRLPITTDRVGGADISGPVIFFGPTVFNETDVLGDATDYEYYIGLNGGDPSELVIAGRTPGGSVDAVNAAAAALVCEGENVLIPASALGISSRGLAEVDHAFKKFTISFYGCPFDESFNNPPEKRLADEKTFNDVVAFGTNEMPLPPTKNVELDRQFINKLAAAGVTVRLTIRPASYNFQFELGAGDYTLRERIDADVKAVMEKYGDLEAITQWGLCDEPSRHEYEYLRLVKEAVHKYDPYDRPVYINLGCFQNARFPESDNIYSQYIDWVDPDYLCYDRYPFFYVDGKATMTDNDYYLSLEYNRDYSLDNSIDCGEIVSAMKVGGNPESDRADITEEHLNWETNLMFAYGCNYIEYYVYDYRHGYTILGPDNEPRWRWYLIKDRNVYMRRMGDLLYGQSLDAVFHLPGADGEYDTNVTPYYPYCGAGEVLGEDAILSFFNTHAADGGMLLITDKHCDDAHGGDHDITLTGFGEGAEWFDFSEGGAGEWKDISTLDRASVSDEGLTLTLTRSSQYLIRK